MMMRNLKNIIYIIYLCLALSATEISCTKFLEEPPSKGANVIVEDLSQLDAMLNKYDVLYEENDYVSTWSTDDTYLSTEFYQSFKPFYNPAIPPQYLFWDTRYLPDNNYERRWSRYYSNIFTANLVLNYANDSKVKGSDEMRATLITDAHFLRAYTYFKLVDSYCLPYSKEGKNGTEPGVPLKKTIGFEETVSRGTLAEVHQFIQAELAEALKTNISLINGGVARSWRANLAGVNAFAARYYLSLGDYAKALIYSNAALAAHNALVDYNTEMSYGQAVQVNEPAVSPNNLYPFPEPDNPATPPAGKLIVRLPVTYDQGSFAFILRWKETMYFRMTAPEAGLAWYAPSDELLALYDKNNDLRYRYHVAENYSIMLGFSKKRPGYIFWGSNRIISGPTTAEMLLIKAECLARNNQTSEALTAINTLRAARIMSGAAVNLTAASPAEALNKILQERRREMPFTSRWYDIRRLNINDNTSDDVPDIVRSFYPYNASTIFDTQAVINYTLDTKGRRMAQPIPSAEIVGSNGKISQNTY